MAELSLLMVITVVFLLAGLVKGVTGMGLPTVTLALITVAIDMPTAMALLLIPSALTNLWQALIGERTRELLKRLWPFLVPATVMVWFGAGALTRVDLSLLSALLGALLMIYGGINLLGFKVQISPRRESWMGPLLGTVNGVLTGMTGSFVVPGVIYLQAIGLPRDMLIQAMGMLFTLSTLALAVALQGNDMLSVELGLLSLVGLVPAIIGMVVGQKVRRKLSESLFRKVFFTTLLLLGGYIVGSSF
ncbi:MAG: sulfite exporter TauE/SafE family protein [Motiliproteus sp.]|nr:sulfite exporter TauE/SafE family protein [Motiliproteus sp.]MCW9054324.1 sulfite exporter TauE/SafE family protein [Motiliproteus sp.]